MRAFLAAAFRTLVLSHADPIPSVGSSVLRHASRRMKVSARDIKRVPDRMALTVTQTPQVERLLRHIVRVKQDKPSVEDEL
jgi:hypothetical protein